MKKNIPTPVAVSIVVIAAVAIIAYGWMATGRKILLVSDVRPLVKEMDAGKPKFAPLPPETDTVMMGGK
jgi:hypothetical protein